MGMWDESRPFIRDIERRIKGERGNQKRSISKKEPLDRVVPAGRAWPDRLSLLQFNAMFYEFLFPHHHHRVSIQCPFKSQRRRRNFLKKIIKKSCPKLKIVWVPILLSPFSIPWTPFFNQSPTLSPFLFSLLFRQR